MNKLNKIMQTEDREKRGDKLKEYAKELGVSSARIEDADTGHIEENLLVERIEARLSLIQTNKTKIIATVSAIAAIIGVIVSWIKG